MPDSVDLAQKMSESMAWSGTSVANTGTGVRLSSSQASAGFASPPPTSPSLSAHALSSQARRGFNSTELLFSQCGDENGVFFWLGKYGGGGGYAWVNPQRVQQVVVTCSCPPSRYCRLDVPVGRAFTSRNYAVGHPVAWWCFDLGVQRRLKCNMYAVHHDNSDAFPRNWDFQGSLDGQQWHTLRSHRNDETIVNGYVTSHRTALLPALYILLNF